MVTLPVLYYVSLRFYDIHETVVEMLNFLKDEKEKISKKSGRYLNMQRRLY